jgi:hypothetical protein
VRMMFAAADKMDYFQFVSFRECRGIPVQPLDNFSVQLDGHPIRDQIQLLDQVLDISSAEDFSLGTIYDHVQAPFLPKFDRQLSGSAVYT